MCRLGAITDRRTNGHSDYLMPQMHLKAEGTVNVVIFAGEFSRKCWQYLSRGDNLRDTTHIFLMKSYGFYFCMGIFSRKRQFREKREFYPMRKFPRLQYIQIQYKVINISLL